MEYMKTLPDNAFDLAICDQPYGGGNEGEINGGQIRGKVRQVQVNHAFGGRFERYNYPPPRRKKGEPNIVGHRTVGRLLQGVVQGVEESDYMGSELLQDATDKVLRGVAKTHYFRGFLNGDGRIRMDFIQGERKGLRVYASRLYERQAFPPDTEASFAVCLVAQQLC